MAVRLCGWMHKLTPNEKSEAKWGCAEEPPYAPVHGWAVPPPKLDGPLRKVAEREADDPEGNLTIVEWGVRKRQRCFSCREYGWGGSAHISEQHPIRYGKAKQSFFGAFPGIFRRFASTAHNTPTQHHSTAHHGTAKRFAWCGAPTSEP